MKQGNSITCAAIILLFLTLFYGWNNLLLSLEVAAIIFSAVYFFYSGRTIVVVSSKIGKYLTHSTRTCTFLFWLIVTLVSFGLGSVFPSTSMTNGAGYVFMSTKAALFLSGFGVFTARVTKSQAGRYRDAKVSISPIIFQVIWFAFGTIMIALTLGLILRIWVPNWIPSVGTIPLFDLIWMFSSFLGLIVFYKTHQD